MGYHLRLTKARSYSGIVSATRQAPDVFVEDKAAADAVVDTGFFKLVEDPGAAEMENQAETTHFDSVQLENLTVPKLKELAMDMGISITGFKTKADYVEAIAAKEAMFDSDDGGVPMEGIIDFGEEGGQSMVWPQQQ